MRWRQYSKQSTATTAHPWCANAARLQQSDLLISYIDIFARENENFTSSDIALIAPWRRTGSNITIIVL
jgi:hypothetical protein